MILFRPFPFGLNFVASYSRSIVLFSIVSAFLATITTKTVFCSGLQQPDLLPRRNLFEQGVIVVLAGGTSWNCVSQPAHAARGAAELDFEFYMRDLVGGNKKEGNIQSSAPPIVSPPRILKGPLLPLLLDDDCSLSCIPVKSLVQLIQQQRQDQRANDIEATIQQKVAVLRSKSSRSFSTRAPWKEEHVSDQYYFDVTAYSLWKVAAEQLPNYVDRDNYARNVGRMIWEALQSKGLTGKLSPETTEGANNRDKIKNYGVLASSTPTILEALELFKSSGFCKDYKIVGENEEEFNSKSSSTSFQVFDELDEESIEEGGTVDCIISIYEPATLGASLQITGEQSRFAPDFVGSTVAAIWETAGIRSSWEVFFVDPEYRPNPKDYFPNEQLLQFTLSKAKKR